MYCVSSPVIKKIWTCVSHKKIWSTISVNNRCICLLGDVLWSLNSALSQMDFKNLKPALYSQGIKLNADVKGKDNLNDILITIVNHRDTALKPHLPVRLSTLCKKCKRKESKDEHPRPMLQFPQLQTHKEEMKHTLLHAVMYKITHKQQSSNRRSAVLPSDEQGF